MLFNGGWADFLYWTGEASDQVIDEAPGDDDGPLSPVIFGELLDRLGGLFR